MAGGWGLLQSTVRRAQGKSPDLTLQLESDEEGEAEDGVHRLPVMSGMKAGPTPRNSQRGSIPTFSRAASPEFAKAVALHNDKLSLSRADSGSSLSSFASDPEVRGEQRVRHSMLKVVAKGRGSGLLPGEEPHSPKELHAASIMEPHSPKELPGAPQASLGSLMSMVKLKKTVVPKLAAAARMKATRASKRTSRGSVVSHTLASPTVSSSVRTTLVPTSLHTSLHHRESFSNPNMDQSLVSLAHVAASPNAKLHLSGSVSPGPALQDVGSPKGRESNAMQSLMAMSKAKRAGRLFLRLAGPGARLAFLKAHPFFRGTSESLRERLAPQLVRRSVEHVSSEVLVQGEQPHDHTDYLFLTSPDFAANIEVTLDNYPIAALSGDAVFGQEAIFGITKAFAFGIRVPADAVHALWVIPRKTLAGLLVKPAFQGDSRILKDRAHSTAVALLRAWYLHPISHVKIRLFDNAEHAFKHRLVQAVEMRLVASGSSVCTEQDTWSSCFCIFRGEAHVKVGTTMLARLAHAPGTSAWAAWWGTLEILGIVEKCPASVVAVTDCIVWQLAQERLIRLRQDYPMECRLFDKVAVEHMRAVQPYTMSIKESPQLKNCDPRFLRELDQNCEKRIYIAGQVVIREGELGGDEIFILVRGKAEVRKSLRNVFARSAAPSRAASPVGDEDRPTFSYDALSTVPVATLQEGSMFGEIAALGVKDRRTATVVCSTICDIRIVKSEHMVQALTHFPEQGMMLERLSDNQMAQDEDDETVDAEKLSSDGLFTDFSTDFLDKLGADMNTLVAFSGQPIMEQGAEVNAMFVLMQGRVAIEIETARLCDFRAPAVIGEMSLLTKGTKSLYTVRSRSHCHFKLIMADRGREILEAFPRDQVLLEKFCSERLESLRSTVCNKYHGVRPSVIAQKQATISRDMDDYEDDDSSADGEAPADWWIDTIFKESDREFIDFLSENLQKIVYFHDEVILREGDEGDSAIILQVGAGIVEVGGCRVGEVKAGSIVGEAVMLGYATLRTATVRAVGLTSAVSLSRGIVLEALQQHPEEMQRVEHMMMIRSSTNKILTNGQGMAPQKGNAINIGGIQMGVMGGSAIKTMKMMAQRRSTTTLDAQEIQKKLNSPSSNARSGRGSAISCSRNGSESPVEESRNGPRNPRKLQRTGTLHQYFPGSRAGSRAASRSGSRRGSPQQSRNPSRAASRQGSGSSSPDDTPRSRLASLKTGGLRGIISGSPRPSLDYGTRRGSATVGVAPELQSDIRASARKLKKQAPAISVNLLDQDGEQEVLMQGAQDEGAKLIHEKITGIAELMLRAPKKRSTSAAGGEQKSHHESLLLSPRSSTVLGLRRAQGPFTGSDARKIKDEPAGLRNISNFKPRPYEVHVETAPDLPVDTDIEMDAEDLKSNQNRSSPNRLLTHRKTDSHLCTRSNLSSAMSFMETPGERTPQGSVTPDEDFLNLDDADLDCDIDDNAMHHTILLKEPQTVQKEKEPVGWVEKRKRMIEAAPMRQACRLARRGDFLPLVPEDKGYQGDGFVPYSSAAKTAARRCGTGPSGASRRLLRAQGVYLSARRWDVRRK